LLLNRFAFYDFSEPLILFLLDYLAAFCAAALFSYWVQILGKQIKNTSSKGENLMKKRIALFTAVLLICSLCACGQRLNLQDSSSMQVHRRTAPRGDGFRCASSAESPAADGAAITTNGGYSLNVSALEHENSSSSSTVYYISDISSDALMKIYAVLGRAANGKVAVKLSTGEAGDTYYLDPNLIKSLVQSVNGTIVECNTAYGGSRSSTAMHMQVAKDHGFTDIARRGHHGRGRLHEHSRHRRQAPDRGSCRRASCRL
jgi:hypothetical protein